jgi:hypothetical protein
VGLLKKLLNNQILSIIMVRMPAVDRKQWAVDRPTWMNGEMRLGFGAEMEGFTGRGSS